MRALWQHIDKAREIGAVNRNETFAGRQAALVSGFEVRIA
jgi:hypothetical protein